MDLLGGAGVFGLGLFSYNRGNYRFDIELGFERFLEGRAYVIEQVGQYREDIRGLTELTNAKCECYQTLTTMVVAVGIPLYCAGRLSLHGPSPPNWLMGLIVTNLCGALCFCAVSSWLHLHAGGRASSAACHLLTRKVRPPFPSHAQLDRARCFSSDFEKQKLGDILRVPFIYHGTARRPVGDDIVRKAEASSRKSNGARINAQDNHESHQVPGWIGSEFENSRGIGYVTAPVTSPLPEHFMLYGELQTEWWTFDVYGRIMMTFGLALYCSAFAYYYVGHIFVELTAIWAAYGAAGCQCILHMLIWQMDVLPNQQGAGAFLWPIDLMLSWSPMVACIAMTLEYKAEFDYNSVIASVVLIFLMYTVHFLATFRWILLIIPDTQPRAEQSDVPGSNWWPSAWKLPSSFTHCLYLLAPPRKLLPGQVCLLQELKSYQPGVASDTFQAGSAARPTASSVKRRCARIDEVFQQINTYRASLPDDSLSRLQSLFGKFQKVASRVGGAAKMPKGRSDYDEFTSDDDTGNGTLDNDTIEDLAAKLDEIEYDLNEIGLTDQMQIPLDDGNDYLAPKPAFTRTVGAHPYTITLYALYPLLLCWMIMIGARVCDTILGEQAFLEKPLLEPWGRFPLRADGRNAPPIGGHVNKMYPWQQNTGTEEEWAAGELDEHHRRLKELNAYRGPHSERQKHLEKLNVVPVEESNAGGPVSSAAKALNNAASDISTFKFFADYTGPSKGAAPAHSLHSLNSALADRIESIESRLAALPESEKNLTGADAHVLQKLHAPATTAVASVEWPAVFEPRVLACSMEASDMIVAVAPRGVAAIASISKENEEIRRVPLSGLAGLGQVVGASWNEEGLLVTTDKGALAQCAGQGPSRGVWKCAAMNAPHLPIGSQGRLLSASVTRTKGSTLQAALVVEGEGAVSLYELSGDSWLSIGEIPIPLGALGVTPSASVSMGSSELIMVTSDGVVHRQSLEGGAAVSLPALTAEDVGLMPREWHMACGLGGNRVVRLAQRKTPEGVWRPEVFLSTMS